MHTHTHERKKEGYKEKVEEDRITQQRGEMNYLIKFNITDHFNNYKFNRTVKVLFFR